jgi:hypothetical protein
MELKCPLCGSANLEVNRKKRGQMRRCLDCGKWVILGKEKGSKTVEAEGEEKPAAAPEAHSEKLARAGRTSTRPAKASREERRPARRSVPVEPRAEGYIGVIGYINRFLDSKLW